MRTVDIIQKYAKKYLKIIQWVSKKDKGQVDAINKGLKKATGTVLTYINADDVYENGALKQVGKFFSIVARNTAPSRCEPHHPVRCPMDIPDKVTR